MRCDAKEADNAGLALSPGCTWCFWLLCGPGRGGTARPGRGCHHPVLSNRPRSSIHSPHQACRKLTWQPLHERFSPGPWRRSSLPCDRPTNRCSTWAIHGGVLWHCEPRPSREHRAPATDQLLRCTRSSTPAACLPGPTPCVPSLQLAGDGGAGACPARSDAPIPRPGAAIVGQSCFGPAFHPAGTRAPPRTAGQGIPHLGVLSFISRQATVGGAVAFALKGWLSTSQACWLITHQHPCSTICLLLVPVRYYGTAPSSLTRHACPARRRARQAVHAVKSCCPGRCSRAAAEGRPRLSGVCDPRSAERCRGGFLVRVMVPCRAKMTMKGS